MGGLRPLFVRDGPCKGAEVWSPLDTGHHEAVRTSGGWGRTAVRNPGGQRWPRESKGKPRPAPQSMLGSRLGEAPSLAALGAAPGAEGPIRLGARAASAQKDLFVDRETYRMSP